MSNDVALGKCPRQKREAIVVEADRRDEFENSLTVMTIGFGEGSQKGAGRCNANDPDWKLPGTSDWWWHDVRFGNEPITEPIYSCRLLDFLHTHYRGHHRWRIVVGKVGRKRRYRDWTRVRWIAVQFNSGGDLVHFRLNWNGQ